jgi:hypothetical protein
MVSVVYFYGFTSKGNVNPVLERTAIASPKVKQEKKNFIYMTVFGILPEQLDTNIYRFTEVIFPIRSDLRRLE